jgi:putative hemolysin
MKLFTLLILLIPFSIQASESSLEKECKESGGSVISSEAEMSTRAGYVKGFKQPFCFIEKDNRSMMIGLETLGSDKPSIAATYLLKGIDMKKIPESKSPNPATDVCRNLGGSSITFYTSGGMTNKYGQSGMCVFGDGSKVSTWSIIYISMDDNYMELKKHIKSKPLALDLPYINK